MYQLNIQENPEELPSLASDAIKTEDLQQWTILWIRPEGMSSISETDLITKVSTYDYIALDTETTGDFTDLYDRKVVMLQLGNDAEQFV